MRKFKHSIFASAARLTLIPVALLAFSPLSAHAEHYEFGESSSLLLDCSNASALFRFKSAGNTFVLSYDREAFRISSIQLIKRENGEERRVRSTCKGLEDILPPFPIGELCPNVQPADQASVNKTLTTYRGQIQTFLTGLCAE